VVRRHRRAAGGTGCHKVETRFSIATTKLYVTVQRHARKQVAGVVFLPRTPRTARASRFRPHSQPDVEGDDSDTLHRLNIDFVLHNKSSPTMWASTRIFSRS